MAQCTTCYGSGYVPGGNCYSCNGSGRDSNGYSCPSCGGSGKRKCYTCGGSGQVADSPSSGGSSSSYTPSSSGGSSSGSGGAKFDPFGGYREYGFVGESKKNYQDGFYEGWFDNGLRDGKGKMSYKNGDVYEGYWFEEKRHGLGTLTYANGRVQKGIWYHDKYIEGAKSLPDARSMIEASSKPASSSSSAPNSGGSPAMPPPRPAAQPARTPYPDNAGGISEEEFYQNEKMAKQGNADSCFIMGQAYMFNSYEKSEEWLNKAIALGNKEAKKVLKEVKKIWNKR